MLPALIWNVTPLTGQYVFCPGPAFGC